MSYYVLSPLFTIALGGASGLGALLALLAWRRRRVRAGLRWLGWALLPLGALAIGFAPLLARIVGAFSRWAVGLAFSPVSWAGVVMLGVGLGLLGVTRGAGRTREVAAQPRSELPATPPSRPGGAPVASKRTGGSRTGSTKDAGASGLLAELEEMGLLDDER